MYKRLRALLRLKQFRDMLDHEYTRPRARNPNLVSDVYDSPAWQSFMGPPQKPAKRIGLLGCSDGFQAHLAGTLSMHPVVYAILSLPPALRFKSEYMLLNMFLPTNAKAFGLKKYYDFSAGYELNYLFHKGLLLVFFTTATIHLFCFVEP